MHSRKLDDTLELQLNPVVFKQVVFKHVVFK